jgi:tRNA modification GTPase
MKADLVQLIAQLEAGIDFAEDDVFILPDATILEMMLSVREPLEALEATFAYGKMVHEGLTLAIVGRPNVGKSSLFNRLVERDRAIVTATPGTTRDLVSETVAIGGIPVKLVDTAGIRQALDEAESIGIRKSMETLADADLALVVLDASQSVSGEDEKLLSQVVGRTAIVVGNKCDLGDKAKSHRDFSDGQMFVSTSALTGEGIDLLRREIIRVAGGDSAVQREAGFLTNVRHQGLVHDAISALKAAETAVPNKIPHEMILMDLYNSLQALDEITGVTTNDDILNLIFSTFCIGK